MCVRDFDFSYIVPQRRLQRALPLLDLYILVRQSVKLLHRRNYDPQSQGQSFLFNLTFVTNVMNWLRMLNKMKKDDSHECGS